MHILLIHQAFACDKEAGGTRHFELARYVVSRGHIVTIVASDVNYLTGDRLEGEIPRQQFFSGVRVLRVRTRPRLHRSFVWRVISFLSFAATSVWAGFRAGSVDVVMGTTPPIFQAASAWLLAFLKRKPFLLEVRDLWPDFAIGLGVLRNPLLIRMSRWLERFLYRRAIHIIVNSPAYRDYVLAKGLPAEMVSLIPNGVDLTMFDPTDHGQTVRLRYGLQEKFVVTYTGALGLANDVYTLLAAADRLRCDPDVCFLIVGDGKERHSLEARARSLNLANVFFIGACPKEEMPAFLAASDACVALLRDIPEFRTTYPNKVFDYMAAGRPVILAIDGVIKQVVEQANAGHPVPPGDPQALAEAVLRLKHDPVAAKAMGAAAREYVSQHFARNKQAEEFMALVTRLSRERPPSLVRRFAKRGLDLVVGLAGLLLLGPLFAAIGLVVKLTLGSPVIFRQVRPGLRGNPFTLLKFRTMLEARDEHGCLLPDGHRVTRIGRFLRSASLDELPELVNVLRGEMSLVGPRPLLMAYLDRYTHEQRRRHEVKPGITGWAQVNGRNAISWEEKFSLDVWYVDNWSLWLDCKILALTLLKVVMLQGITAKGHATMPEFTGNYDHQ